MAKRIRGESGYSLVEVMVAIIIMALAILPMVAMFDMGLHSTIEGSKYDKARMLANLKLEQAKNLPFDSVRNNFPEPVGTTTTYNGSGFYQSSYRSVSGGADFTGFEYRVEKQYMAQPSTDPGSSSENWSADTSGTPTKLIRVTVTVQWDDNKTYTTYGLVTG